MEIPKWLRNIFVEQPTETRGFIVRDPEGRIFFGLQTAVTETGEVKKTITFNASMLGVEDTAIKRAADQLNIPIEEIETRLKIAEEIFYPYEPPKETSH